MTLEWPCWLDVGNIFHSLVQTHTCVEEPSGLDEVCNRK